MCKYMNKYYQFKIIIENKATDIHNNILNP